MHTGRNRQASPLVQIGPVSLSSGVDIEPSRLEKVHIQFHSIPLQSNQTSTVGKRHRTKSYFISSTYGVLLTGVRHHSDIIPPPFSPVSQCQMLLHMVVLSTSFACPIPNRTTLHDRPIRCTSHAHDQRHEIPSAQHLNISLTSQHSTLKLKLETSGHPSADNDHKLKFWNATPLSQVWSTPFVKVIHPKLERVM